MARTPRRLSQASSKRKLIILSPRRIRLQQVKNSPVRSAMKAGMTVFKLSNTRHARRARCRKLTTRTAANAGAVASIFIFLQALSISSFSSRVFFLLPGALLRVVSKATFFATPMVSIVTTCANTPRSNAR